MGALLAYAWWAVARPPFSGTATAAVLAAGAAAALAGLAAGPRPRGPAGAGPRHAVPWLILVAAAAAWQLAAYGQHPRYDHPTLSSLANALLESHPARAVAFVLWALATVHLARR